MEKKSEKERLALYSGNPAQKEQSFFEKHRNFKPLSLTFCLVASAAMVLGFAEQDSKEDAEYQRHQRVHTMLQSQFDETFITISPLAYREKPSHYVVDILWQYRPAFSGDFCQKIVPLILQQHRFLESDDRGQDKESYNRMTRFAGYVTTHPDGIEHTNNIFGDALFTGVYYDYAFSLASTLSCDIGESLKQEIFSLPDMNYRALEQSLLSSFNRVVGDIKEAVATNGYEPEVYFRAIDGAIKEEQERLVQRKGAQEKPTLSL